VKSASELRDAVRFPCVVKTSVGTASRGIWFVRNEGDLTLEGAAGSRRRRHFAGEVLVQDLIAGTTEKAQSVFCRGNCSAFMPIGKSPPASAAARRSSKA
jgi:carbamoylphosphate synthase large subunit